MTPCRGGCGVPVAGTRCRSCANAYNARARRRKGRTQVNPGYLFTKPSGFNKGHRFGKLAQPSPCPWPWWADPLAQQDREVFARLAQARFAEVKGREKHATYKEI